MSAPGPAADARLALRLLALAPQALKGIALRGGGPLRDQLLDEFRAALPAGTPWRRLPPGIDDERLSGGIDLAASLAAGRTLHQAGLLEAVAGGVLVVPLAERLPQALAGRLAQALDTPGPGCTLVLLDDGANADEAPPPALTERLAFALDLTAERALPAPAHEDPPARQLAAIAPLDSAALTALVGAAEELGIASLRAPLLAAATARAHAALHGRASATMDDLAAAARLVLAPRATRLPPSDTQDEPPPQDAPQPDTGEPATSAESDRPPEDVVLAAALAALPPDLLAQLAAGGAKRRAQGSGGGQRAKSKLRGKPLGAIPGLPRGGARLALIDSLRAAVPWQPLRRAGAGAGPERGLIIHRGDLRIRRFEERSAAITVFCVDASGSTAATRLAEAKGAVERLLAQAYVKRTEVALIAFRGSAAEVLLPPTRSLTRARRALAELPGGGGTPLASGITLARKLADAVATRGQTPFLVFLTDGSANIAADGTPGRAMAQADARSAARALASSGHAVLVIDISPRPRPAASDLAQALGARYLPLPLADSAALERAVTAVRSERIAA